MSTSAVPPRVVPRSPDRLLGKWALEDRTSLDITTIYRKMKIFRERFGGHPDEFVFDWISLDLPTAWTNIFMSALGVEDSP